MRKTTLPHSPTPLLRQGLQRVQSKPEKQWQVPQKAPLPDLTVWLPPGFGKTGSWSENHRCPCCPAHAAGTVPPDAALPDFGTDGLDNASGEVLNDTSLIMENIAETENSIETILREKHDALLEEIQAEADALGSDCEYSVTDEFADRIIYESSLIISQFCASQDDYQEIHLAKLERLLRDHTDSIFTYSTIVTSREETDEDTGESYTIYHYEYVVEYAGDSYFADHVFSLTEDQLAAADEYAANLNLFLLTRFTRWKPILT